MLQFMKSTIHIWLCFRLYRRKSYLDTHYHVKLNFNEPLSLHSDIARLGRHILGKSFEKIINHFQLIVFSTYFFHSRPWCWLSSGRWRSQRCSSCWHDKSHSRSGHSNRQVMLYSLIILKEILWNLFGPDYKHYM